MMRVATVSATDDNISSDTSTQDIITYDTVETTYQPITMMKEEKENIETDNVELSNINNSKNIQKDVTTKTKSADETSENTSTVKKDPTFYFNGGLDTIRLDEESCFFLYGYLMIITLL